MEAMSLYISLAAATVLSLLVSLCVDLRIRASRIVTVLGSYGLLVALLFVEPWWRVLVVWGIAGLASGVICYAVDWSWTERGRKCQPGLSWTTPWWLVPMGLLGWPDMLPQTIELAQFERRVFGRPR